MFLSYFISIKNRKLIKVQTVNFLMYYVISIYWIPQLLKISILQKCLVSSKGFSYILLRKRVCMKEYLCDKLTFKNLID